MDILDHVFLVVPLQRLRRTIRSVGAGGPDLGDDAARELPGTECAQLPPSVLCKLDRSRDARRALPRMGGGRGGSAIARLRGAPALGRRASNGRGRNANGRRRWIERSNGYGTERTPEIAVLRVGPSRSPPPDGGCRVHSAPRPQLADDRVALVVRQERSNRREHDALLGLEMGLKLRAELLGCAGAAASRGSARSDAHSPSGRRSGPAWRSSSSHIRSSAASTSRERP